MKSTIIEQLNNILPGQVLVYFKGRLANAGGIHDLRNAAYRLYLEDRAYLVQKRIGDEFQYIAIGKKSQPSPKQINQRIFYVQNLERSL